MSNENGQARERRVIRISKTKLVITIVVVVILFGLFKILTNTFGTSSVGMAPSMNYPVFSDSVSESYVSNKSMPYPRPGYGGNGDITDTREFMKTSYSATLKTRDVSKVVNDVKNIVKGADGRVDNIQSGEKYGSISFVVPKTNFDSFRDQVEALTQRKLYTENISSQNLLTTKQGIEAKTTSVETTLATLNAQKSALEKQHIATLGTLNNSLYNIQAQISVIKTSIASVSSSTDSGTVIASLKNQLSVLENNELVAKQNILNENNIYTKQKSSIESSIANENLNLTSIKKEDTNFGNNIETVTGNISVNWVSVWNLIGIYSPISPVWLIIILIILIWAYLNHKKYTPKIVIG